MDHPNMGRLKGNRVQKGVPLAGRHFGRLAIISAKGWRYWGKGRLTSVFLTLSRPDLEVASLL
jgi:hypothetical protein